jgi:flagellar basal body P-ring formation protein FlgA
MEKLMRHILFVLGCLLFALPAQAELQSGGLYTLSLSDIEQAVANALQENGSTPLATARIEGVTRDTAYGHSTPLTASIKSLKADPVSKRWSANVNFVSGAEIVSVLPMQGRYTEMVMLPTAKRPISAGQTIAEGDVEMRAYPANYARGSVLKDLQTIIGKVPHRIISANRPLREEEFTTPNVVRKNASVTLQYQTAAINITTAGQAMENGSVGDVIPVLNLNSKKIVRATILDKDTVSVSGNVQTRSAQASAVKPKPVSSLEEIYAN